MMTLDEAIKHCEEKSCGNSECAMEHQQLNKWLKELKVLKEEPVSEDLEEAANNALEGLLDKYDLVGTGSCLEMFKLGAKWQITKLMKDATEVTVHIEAGNYPYIPQIELYDYDKDIALAKEGDKYKVILIKED